jgi:hypothetical protein
MDQDLNVRGKTIKFFEENIEVRIHDLVSGKAFLDMSSKA